MKTGDAVREIMKSQSVTVTQIANRANSSHTVITMRLNRDNITIDKLNELLRLLDYKITIVPKSEKTPKDSYEVE